MNKILLLGLVLFSAFATSQTKELSVTYSWIIKIYQACSLAKGCASSFEYNGSVPILVGNSAEKRDDLFTFNFSISQLNKINLPWMRLLMINKSIVTNLQRNYI